MNRIIKPKVSLVGAGPGDIDLITVKGLKALQTADVILYDALANEELLEEAPSHALKVYVGKRANKHRYSQKEINLMLAQYAFSHGHVVRLKGGDPFVFGRGHEELQFINSFDIEVNVVPGISSSIAVAEMQHVPLTRRGLNESFWVLTGTTKSGKLSKDIALAAQSSATVVILMGMKKMEEIMEIFKENHKSETAVMVIQNGTRENEKYVLGHVEDIVAKAKAENVGTPGIIVIGEVVNLHPDLALQVAANEFHLNQKVK